MEIHRLSHEFELRIQKLGIYLKRLKHNQEKDFIHKFRVNVKYLRGMLQIIALIHDDKAMIKAIKSSFKKVYQVLGIIREDQINLKLASHYVLDKSTLKKYRNQVKLNINLSKKKLNVLLKAIKKPDKDAIHKAANVLKNKGSSTIDKCIFDYMQSHAKHIKLLLNDLSDEETLHNIRKDLKAIKAVYRSISNTVSQDWEYFTVELLQVEVCIGKWHDKIVLRNSLICFMKQFPKRKKQCLNAIRLLEAEHLMFVEELPLLLKNLLPVVDNLAVNLS